MNELCADIGYKSINHYGEQLCGDHVDIVKHDDGSCVVVLADGLGSGVKASILSTLTSKIISTMIAENLPIEDSVSTIAATLPVDSKRGVAYSTFTIIHLKKNGSAELIQFDNPHVILIRNGDSTEYPKTELNIDGKIIYKSDIVLKENDVFIAMSDGCPHAGIGTAYNFGWRREDIAQYMEGLVSVGYTAKTLSTMLINECYTLYGEKPGDDATSCVIKIRKREPMNILFGPPANRDDCDRMMSLFFSKEGKHIICGGTTSSIAAKWLKKPLKTNLSFERSDIPPTAEIEGIDLVTEGVITLNRVIEYAKDHIAENKLYEEWEYYNNGAALISRMLFEEATDINFYVGKAINPAHQHMDLPINYSIKMKIVQELTECLKKMGKSIKVSYF
ncbi:SpoIIE family protein phosphatase [Ruminococcus flavefaciens]|uniref:SpoIIE family protein phosphatase n=1 Tax=Ruminococcus flavefaciens TaxID=1265 RepID=UPI0026EBCE49|nr:SpoIIE family protein phosphatase [Ruminococcus flavefaciens]